MTAAAIEGDLPDINAWVALCVPDHEHHAIATKYWHHAASSKLWFCRHTMIGLMRLLCQPRVMGPRVLDPTQALETYRALCEQPVVGVQADPAELDQAFRHWARVAPWPARMWPDAYLAAFARAAGLRLVSFDRDFSRFPGLQWLHLNPESLETVP